MSQPPNDPTLLDTLLPLPVSERVRQRLQPRRQITVIVTDQDSHGGDFTRSNACIDARQQKFTPGFHNPGRLMNRLITVRRPCDSLLDRLTSPAITTQCRPVKLLVPQLMRGVVR